MSKIEVEFTDGTKQEIDYPTTPQEIKTALDEQRRLAAQVSKALGIEITMPPEYEDLYKEE